MAFWLLLLMLTACAAVPQDLSGKKFLFPEKTNTAHVKLTPSGPCTSAVTVCLRSKTDLSRNHALFSLATSSHHNAFLIFKDSKSNIIDVFIENNKIEFAGQDYKLNTWHSICATWESTNGLVQLWLDGKSTIKKYSGGSAINSPTIVLGQDQDIPAGRFDAGQSFVGEICDVHVWSSVLSPCEIKRFMSSKYFTPGNVVNWKALEFQKSGRVVIENKKKYCSKYFPFYHSFHRP